MHRTHANWLRALAVPVLLAMVAAATPALADNIAITYSPAGVYAPNFSSTSSAGICYNTTVCNYGLENFSGWPGGSPYASTFNDAGTGTYNQPGGVAFNGNYTVGANTGTTGSSGAWVPAAQNQYGGVNGTNYPELFGNGSSTTPANYNLSLATTGVPGANYFGIWISALDAFNNLKLYDGTTMIADFTATTLQAKLGNCTSPSTNLYCGNPTTQFKGQDSGELFVYVNVFDLSGFITNVQFNDTGSSGFESSNHAVAYANPIHVTGAVLIPEPGSAGLIATAVLGLLQRRRRRYASSVSSA